MTPPSLPPDIVEAFSRAGRLPGAFGTSCLHLDETPSTNDLAAREGERGQPEGLVVVADAQSAGRGRVGRSWASPPGAGLYVSVLLRPTRRDLGLLTIAAGVALAEGVQASTGLDVSLKWPNDLQVGPRKLGGILAEATSVQGTVRFVVVGFGINVLTSSYPPDVTLRATSIEAETGRRFDRGTVLVACLDALEARYRAFERSDTREIVAAWRSRARPHLARSVRWSADGRSHLGTAMDIDDDGALVVESDAGPVRISSGEVQWLT
jgi:BirA family biotin operon repressor/biotin-[acetyl-CoA-carboxylase] ligase